MNTQPLNTTQRQDEPQKQPVQPGEPVQVSLPQSDEVQIGPFEHSGETARQTEEAKREEVEQKGVE